MTDIVDVHRAKRGREEDEEEGDSHSYSLATLPDENPGSFTSFSPDLPLVVSNLCKVVSTVLSSPVERSSTTAGSSSSPAFSEERDREVLQAWVDEVEEDSTPSNTSHSQLKRNIVKFITKYKVIEAVYNLDGHSTTREGVHPLAVALRRAILAKRKKIPSDGERGGQLNSGSSGALSQRSHSNGGADASLISISAKIGAISLVLDDKTSAWESGITELFHHILQQKRPSTSGGSEKPLLPVTHHHQSLTEKQLDDWKAIVEQVVRSGGTKAALGQAMVWALDHAEAAPLVISQILMVSLQRCVGTAEKEEVDQEEEEEFAGVGGTLTISHTLVPTLFLLHDIHFNCTSLLLEYQNNGEVVSEENPLKLLREVVQDSLPLILQIGCLGERLLSEEKKKTKAMEEKSHQATDDADSGVTKAKENAESGETHEWQRWITFFTLKWGIVVM